MKPYYKIYKNSISAKYKARIFADQFTDAGAETPEFDTYEEADRFAKSRCVDIDNDNWFEVTK